MATKKTTKKQTSKKNTKVAEVTSEKITPTEKNPSSRFSRKAIWVVAAILGLGVLLYLANRYLVIAWVDGKPVTRLEYYSMLDKKYGNDIKEQLIVERLITDEAQKKGIMASDQEVASESASIEKQQGGKEQLDQILQLQGLSRNEFTKLVKLQVLRTKMFGQNVQVSDDEVKKYMETNKDQFLEVTPQVTEQARGLLKQQKTNQAFNDWLKSALQSSRVVRVNP